MISQLDPYEVNKEYQQRVERLKKASEDLNGSIISKKEFLFAKKAVEEMADDAKEAQQILLLSDQGTLEGMLTSFNEAYKILNNVDTTVWKDELSDEEKIRSYIN